MLMLTDIVGTSVLTFAGVAKDLGWVFTILFIVGLCPISVYCANLMSRTRNKIKEERNIEILNMGEAARICFGSDQAAVATYAVVYGYGFLGNASYLLTMGNALQGVFYDSLMCVPTTISISCVLVLPVVLGVRTLSDSVALCFANLVAILVVLVLCFNVLVQDGPLPCASRFNFAEQLTPLTVLGAATNVVYSYAGQWIYFEMMVEMKKPEEFPKVFYVNAPLQVVLYLTVAVLSYFYLGDQADSKGTLLTNLPPGMAFRWASGILFAHVVVAFLIKNVIIARQLHRSFSPKYEAIKLGEEGGCRAHFEHMGFALVVLAGGWVMANAVPYFSQFLGLLGGLLSGPISFLLPIAFFVAVQKKQSAAFGGHGEDSERSPGVCDKFMMLSCTDRLLCALTALFTVMVMFIGTYQEIHTILNMGPSSPPFSCQLPLPKSATVACATTTTTTVLPSWFM